MESSKEFYKNKPNDQIWWVDNAFDVTGKFEFTFDKKKIFNLFQDYPQNLTAEQKSIFDKENPFWVDFFNSL